MKLRRITAFGASLLISLSSLMVFAPAAHAAADTCTWTGAVNNNFSDGGNWSGCDNSGVPEDGDSLVFDDTSLASPTTLNNDLNNLSVASITFQGNNTSPYTNQFTITGNAITLQGGITLTGKTQPRLELDITLGADQSFVNSSTTYGNLKIGENEGDNTLNLGSHALTLSNGIDSFLSVSSIVSGTGGITKTGAGTANLRAANNFSGAVNVNAGKLYANDKDALGTSAGGTTVANGAQLTYSLPSAQKTATINEPLTLNGSTFTSNDYTEGVIDVYASCGLSACNDGNITLAGAITLGADVKVSTEGSKVTITGSLSGQHTIQLIGGDSGTLVINSSNNDSATDNGSSEAPAETVTVNAGDDSTAGVSIGKNQTYVINGKRGDIHINDGGVLKGTGTVGDLYVNPGGTLAPGQSPGCLNSGDLTFSSDGVYQFEVGGATACTEYDQTKVTGTVTLGDGTLQLVRYNDFKPVAGQSYTIIDNDSNDAVTGTFKDLAEGATFTVDGYVFKISYVGGDGNDVVVTVQSVPSTPNTGIRLLTSNPLVTLVTTTLLAGSIALLARKYGKATAR